MSRLVDALVEKGLMKRRPCDDDRRHVRLSVTPAGEATLKESRTGAQEQLARVVSKLNREQQRELSEDMRLLREIFATEVSVISRLDPSAAVVKV